VQQNRVQARFQQADIALSRSGLQVGRWSGRFAASFGPILIAWFLLSELVCFPLFGRATGKREFWDEYGRIHQ
jgi:hypothetical protein